MCVRSVVPYLASSMLCTLRVDMVNCLYTMSYQQGIVSGDAILLMLLSLLVVVNGDGGIRIGIGDGVE